MFYLDRFILTGVPLPPNINPTHTGKTQKHKTAAVKKWEQAFITWCLANEKSIKAIKDCFNTHNTQKEPVVLDIMRHYFFPRSALLAKNGTIKSIDILSFMKPLDDCLESILQIDSRHFFNGTFYRHVCEKEPFANVVISLSHLEL